MPWVRMHGIKDYWDMVRMLDDYPEIKQTFNFAPSLLVQIEDYLNGSTTDRAYLLSAKDPEMFSEAEKIEALKTLFLANSERMVKRYPRYAELLARRGVIRSDRDLYAVRIKFSTQDFRDLQVWWNLAWVGEYSRFDPPFKHYIDKQRDFSEKDKQAVLSAQMGIIARIIPHHVEAMNRKQIEIAVSPFYHPILPLLCDSNVASIADPKAVLPNSRFKYPKDADFQIKAALDYAKKIFGIKPVGMWPSEGSVSDAALNLIAKNGIAWAATDETVLHKTFAKSGRTHSSEFLEKYFPYSFAGAGNPVMLFFRDHDLSDRIGFVYSHWGPDGAAHDFITRLLGIRESIVERYGENGLDYAVVPIILDGENAWEFYQSDGKDFLRTLYYLLSKETKLKTVLPSEVKPKRGNVIQHLEPGSWINGNFDIWIGHDEDNKAWDLLHEARRKFEKTSGRLSPKKRADAFREILISEGSDWCWWYGDEHKSVLAAEFDELFRYHLRQVYVIMGITPPSQLEVPIKRRIEHLSYRQPLRMISPSFTNVGIAQEWEKAGFVEQEQPSGAMQKTGLQIKRVRFGNDKKNIYLMIETTQRFTPGKLLVQFFTPIGLTVEIGSSVFFRTDGAGDRDELSLSYELGETVQIRISSRRMTTGEGAAFTISVQDQNAQTDSLPHQGLVEFKVLQ